MTDLVLVFFESSDKLNWTPMDRAKIPEWLRDEAIWDRLIAGEAVRNTFQDAEQRGMKWYTATAVNRMEVSKSSIILPPRYAQ